ncbi:uncharacterized protein [Heterodontus francisci]
MSGRLSSMRSSVAAPKRCASTNVFTRTSRNAVTPTAAKGNREEALQCRLSLPIRKSPLQSCSKKPQTVGTNNLKASAKQISRVPSISTVKNRRFSTGCLSLNSTQKLDRKMNSKFKMAALPKENSLNATYCLPPADGKCTRQIPLKTKDLDVVMIQRCLPNISVADSIPEHEQTQSAHFSLPLVEPSNLSPLLTSFVAQECLHIAAELSNKSETCPAHLVAINPVPMTNVSIINEEPAPSDCSVYSCYSDTSPAKSPKGGYTSQLQENGLKDTSCQLINALEAIQTESPSVSAKINNDFIETGTLPCSSTGNLIQLNETLMLSDLNDCKNGVLDTPKHDVHSRNGLSKLPTVSNYEPSPCTVELIQLDETIVLSVASNTPSLCTKNDSSCKSSVPAKTLTDCKPSVSRSDLLSCEETTLSVNENKIVPKHGDSFENELYKAPALLDAMPSLSTGDLIQLNETMSLRDDKNATFDSSKHESNFGNDCQASTVSNCKLSLSAGGLVQLNGTMIVDDHQNATFDTSKHEGSLETDSQATTLSNCKLPPSIGDIVQLNSTMTVEGHQNATFDASKHESSFGNDLLAIALSDGKLPPSTGDIVQLNGTMLVDDHNATFDASKHEGNHENGSKATTLSSCKKLLATGDQVQSNGIMTVNDCKDATFDASKHEESLENNTSKTNNFPNSKLPQSLGGANEVVPLSFQNLQLVRKCEGHQGSALDSISELQQEQNGGSSNSKDSTSTLNLGKGDDSTCTEKRLNEANQGDGDLSCSAELHKRTRALEKSLHLINPSENKELNIGEHAEFIHDLVNSEWAPNCMSTPSVALKQSFLEYLPLDHSFQTSSSTLQDDSHGVDCPDKEVKTKDDSRSSRVDVTETKTCSRKIVNAPRLGEQLQQTKVATAGSLKHTSYLPGARRKHINEAQICGAEKSSLPFPARTSKLGSSIVGRGGKPPMQPPSFSKMCLPKPRQTLGRLSSVMGTGQNAGNNQIPSCQVGTHTKMPPKAESNQLLAKAVTKIPGLKTRSPLALSKLPVQETQKAESKQAELFNIGMGGLPSVNKNGNKSLVLTSKDIVTGIKRPGSIMEQKRRLCPSPKRSKTVGEVTVKFPKKSGTKPLSENRKQKIGVKAGERLTSEPKGNLNKIAEEESTSESKQELEVA